VFHIKIPEATLYANMFKQEVSHLLKILVYSAY